MTRTSNSYFLCAIYKVYGRGELQTSLLLTWNDGCRFSYIDHLEEKVQMPTIREHRQVGFKVGKEE